MSRNKNTIKKICAVCLACTFPVTALSCSSKLKTDLTGDSNKDIKQVDSAQPAKTQKLTRFFDANDLEYEQTFSEYSSIIGNTQDSIYCMSYPSAEASSFITYCIDLGDLSAQAKTSDLEAYSSQYVLRTDKYIYDISDNEVSNLRRTDITTGKQETSSDSFSGNITSVCSDGSGNIYLITYSSVYIFSSDLKLIKVASVDQLLTKYGFEQSYIYSGCVDKQGNVYLASWTKGTDTYCIYKLSPDMVLADLTGLITDLQGSLRELVLDSDQNLSLITGDAEVMIDKIDPGTGETLLRYELSDALITYGSSGKYDMVYTSSDGNIYGYIYDDDRSELIVSSDTYSSDDTSFLKLSVSDNFVYITCACHDNSDGKIAEVDLNGQVINNYPVPDCIGDDEYLNPVKLLPSKDGDGSSELYYMMYKYGISYDDYVHEISSYCVYKTDPENGSEKLFETQEFDVEYLPSSFGMDSCGRFVIPVENNEGKATLYVYENDPNPIGEISFPVDFSEVAYMFTGTDNDLYCIERYSNKIYRIDTQKMSVTEVCDFKTSGQTFYPGTSGYDFYYQNDAGILGYNMQSGKTDEIFMSMDCDSDFFPANNAVVSPEIIISSQADLNELTGELKNFRLCKYLKADQKRLDELNSEQIISLAGCLEKLKPQIKKFNRENKKYRIAAKDYSAYETMEDNILISGGGQLDADMITGNIPDIIILNDDMDILSYLSKGILCDMNTFIDNDPDIDRESLNSSILNAFTYKNSLYLLPVDCYCDDIYAAKTSKFGQRDSWTFKEFFEYSSQNSDVPVFCTDYRYYIFSSLIDSYVCDFVDLNGHSCDFNNETFIRLLEYVRDNTTSDIESCNEENINYDFALKNDLSLIKGMTNFDITDYHRMISLYAGENICLPGMPSDSAKTREVKPGLCFSVTCSSDVKEGAWSFIREFLTDEYQNSVNLIPLKNSSLEKIIDDNCKDEESARCGYDENNEQVLLPCISDEEKSAYIKYLQSPARSSLCYKKIKQIISEEAEIFFSSGCTSEEAAASVQSKVSRYLDELF